MSSTSARVNDRRTHLRFDKVFTVYITGPDGMSRGVGRNISARGLFVETREPVPLGGRIKVTFAGEDGTEMTCLCEVRYQVALAYGKKDGHEGHTRGVGLRIVAYETKDDSPMLLVARERVLH
ncbi:MAG TPA: PilZ domain-containing protein [Gemmatimonadaceae bacterium]|nr:PilZ domain-containing protein [Gemmatimonadaceae bacterium]